MRRFLPLFLTLACLPAYAEFIQVVAVGSGINYDDPAELLPFPEPPWGSAMTLTFVYDSETADTDPDPNKGMYTGAIQTMTLAVGDTRLSALPDNDIQVRNDAPSDGDGDGVPDHYVDYWIATTYLENSSLRTEISLPLFRTTGNAIDSDALVMPSALFASPGLNFIVYRILDRSDPDNPVTLAIASTFVDSLAVTVVPVPASGVLVVPCLLVIMSRLRRRVRNG